jgi:hypothetical protein
MTDQKVMTVDMFDTFVNHLRGGSICDDHWVHIRRSANIVIGIQPCGKLQLRNIMNRVDPDTKRPMSAMVVSDDKGDPGLVDLETGEYISGEIATDLDTFADVIVADGWTKVANSPADYYAGKTV